MRRALLLAALLAVGCEADPVSQTFHAGDSIYVEPAEGAIGTIETCTCLSIEPKCELPKCKESEIGAVIAALLLEPRERPIRCELPPNCERYVAVRFAIPGYPEWEMELLRDEDDGG